MQGEFKIPLCDSNDGELFLKPFASYNKILDGVAFRILSTIHDGAFLQKQPTALRRWCLTEFQLRPEIFVVNVGCR